MAVLKCHYFQWLHKTTELGLVASGIVAAQSLIENQTFSTLVKGAQQITEHRAEPHWVEGLLVRDASEIIYLTFIYLPDMPYVNPFQLPEVDCELGTTWKKTEGYCARFQKNLKDHKAGPGWRQTHHKRLHQTILPITTWWPFWWSWWKYDLVSHTLSAVNLSFLNSSIHPPWFLTGKPQNAPTHHLANEHLSWNTVSILANTVMYRWRLGILESSTFAPAAPAASCLFMNYAKLVGSNRYLWLSAGTPDPTTTRRQPLRKMLKMWTIQVSSRPRPLLAIVVSKIKRSDEAGRWR